MAIDTPSNDARLSKTALVRAGLRLFVPAALLLSLILYWAEQMTNQTRLDIIESRESGYLEAAKQIVDKEFAEIVGDLRIIANLPILWDYLDRQNPQDLDELAALYQLIARQHGRYDQIRYLDAGGQEILRVNYHDGQPSRVAREYLQNKAQRYYFQEAMALNPGEVYVSPLDLNVENGQLEIPYKPMIRFCAPVFDRNGQRQGAIVLNYLGDQLRQSLRGVLDKNPGHHAMLLNRDGYWLSAPDPNDEWGFSQGKPGPNFAQRFAEEWPAIHSQAAGKLRTEHGFFLYATIQPLLSLPNFAERNTPLSARSAKQAEDYRWKIVLHFDEKNLTASGFFHQPAGWGLMGVLYVFLAAGSLLIARATLRRRQAEQRQRHANAEIADLYEHAPCGYHSLDANGTIVRINQTELDWLGYSRDDVVGKLKFSDIVSADSVRQFQTIFPRFLRQGYVHDLEFDMRCKDGSYLPVLVSATGVYDKQGQFVMSRSTMANIRARKQAEIALRAKQAELQRAQAISHIGSWFFDAVHDSLEWSEETYSIVGLAPELTPTYPLFFERVHPDDVASVEMAWQAATAGQQPYDLVHRLLVAGETKWVHEKAELFFDGDGRFTGAFGTMHDITQLKIAEQQLQQLNLELESRRAEAEAANRAKSQFLASMSHEIRTPMNAVLGMAQLLEREPLAPAQQAMVGRIRGAGRTLLGIIDDILDFSRIEAGQLTIVSQPFDMAKVLANIDSLQGNVAREKGLAWHVDAPAQPSFVLGDSLRLEQILLNLTGNAIKFTERGEVGVRMSALETGGETTVWRCEIRDTGIGIAEQTLPYLFNPFIQADGGITRRYGGSGLGLSICKRLVELMHGRLGVDSVPHQGSIFWFELPLEPVEVTEPLETAGQPDAVAHGRALAGFHILVADDNETNREILSLWLASAGARVTLAEDGQQALTILESQGGDVDAVLMDMQMPIMDGYAATRAIREQLGLSNLPVLACSAAVFPEEQRAMLAAGANQVLAKPLDFGQLLEALTQCLAVKALTYVEPAPTEPEPASAEDDQASVDFPTIAGIDRAWAQRQYVNDGPFFAWIVQRFINDWRDLPARLAADLAGGQRQAAQDKLHKFYGAAGFIGAKDLAETARATYLALRDEAAELADLQAALTQSLLTLEDGLIAAGPYDPPADLPG